MIHSGKVDKNRKEMSTQIIQNTPIPLNDTE
jgi:hypothetical protein